MARRDDDISPSVTPGVLGGTADLEASSRERAREFCFPAAAPHSVRDRFIHPNDCLAAIALLVA